MSFVNYSVVIEKYFTELDALLRNFVYDGYHAISSFLQYPLGLAITIYIALLGLSISQGWVQMSMGNLVKATLKIGLVYTAAMNWAFFSEYFIKLLTDGAGEIGSTLMKASPVHIPHFGDQGIKGALQMSLIEYTKIGGIIWNQGSWHHVSPYFVAALYWFFGVGIAVVATFELTQAIIMTSISMTLAPLFVAFTLFKPTQGLFDRWLGTLIGYALQLIFISGVLALVLSLSQWVIAGYTVGSVIHVNLSSWVPITLVGVICIGLLFKAASQAQAIGGSVSVASSSSFIAGAMGGFMGGAMGAMRAGTGVMRGGAAMLGKGKALMTGAAGQGMHSMGGIMRKMRGGDNG